jgi:putative heme iron utilization protein
MSEPVSELKKYTGYGEEEIAISKWLEERKGRSYTCLEVRDGIIGIPPLNLDKKDVSTAEKLAAIAVNVAANLLAAQRYQKILNEMVASGRIKMLVAKGEEHYYYE